MRETLVRLAGAVLVAFSVSALADDKNKCLDAKDHHVAIKGCSEIIRRDPKDAIAYYLRGNALAKNGDLGQAIADFSKAIALNPGFAPPYDGRAAAYVAKGDYTRAVADVTKAAELAPKKGQKAAKATVTASDKAPAAMAKDVQVKPAIAKDVQVKPPIAGAAATAKKTGPPKGAQVKESTPEFAPFRDPSATP